MNIGDRVNRIEDQKITGATVLELDGENVRIAYDEGGEGWWPLDALTPLIESD